MMEYVFFSIKLTMLFFGVDSLLQFFNRAPLTRWYWLHALSNMIVCWYTFTPTIKVALDPLHHIMTPVRFEESAIIIAILHIYHLLFFHCTKSDLFHHLTFVLLATTTQYLVNWGYLSPFFHFFICGLPGGIDYFALALVKEKKILKSDRLKLAVELNTWLRAPGMIITWSFMYLWFLYKDKTITNILCFTIATFSSVFNAQYYSRQVTLYAGKHAY